MTCIYHSRGFDGLCSGRILQEAYPDAKMIGYDYGQPVPELDTNDNIIMADVTFLMEDMIRIRRGCQANSALFTVIDHHVSFVKQMGGGGHKKAAGFQHNDFILTQSH